MNRFRQWMVGRYGADALGTGIVVLYVVLSIVNMFFRVRVIIAVSYLLVLLWGFRFFSRNIQKRYAENQKFLILLKPFQAMIRLMRRRFMERDTSRFYRCPRCKQTIRVPKGKGKIMITCPKCHNEFAKRT